MTQYRRATFPGGHYFFTVVTHHRRGFLTDDLARTSLRASWRECQQTRPFRTLALCLLPDHLHCVWRLPEGDADFSMRWAAIKAGFTRQYLAAGGAESDQNASRTAKRERGIWQRRFWERQIRDEDELQQHVNYIHYNPVKHGLVKTVDEWPWSTYHKYQREGGYTDHTWQEKMANEDLWLQAE